MALYSYSFFFFVGAVVASTPPPLPPPGQFSLCAVNTSKFSKQSWCDPTLSHEVRVADMIARMTTEEKLQYLMIRSPAAPSLGLPPYNWWEEATHGVTPQGRTGDATNVAFPITTAMSFNRTLWHATGALIGREARALMNMGKAGSDFWAPVVNLASDGRWGRNIETPGEDPVSLPAGNSSIYTCVDLGPKGGPR